MLVNDFRIPADVEDALGYTPVDYTAQNGDIESLRELQACNVPLSPELPHLAAKFGRVCYLKEILKSRPIAKDCRDAKGCTPVFRGAQAGHVEAVRHLLDCGINWEDVDKRQRNVLHLAVDGGNSEVVDLLVARARARGALQGIINSQDKYVGDELCFLIRGKDKGES